MDLTKNHNLSLLEKMKSRDNLQPSKLQSLIVHLVKELDDVLRVKLAKLIYLIDWEHYCTYAKTLTDSQYTRQEMGPLAIGLAWDVDYLDGHEILVEKTPSSGYHHTLGHKPRFEPNFNILEKGTIQTILNRYGKYGNTTLKKIAYKTEPMKDILEKEKKIGCKLIGAQMIFTKFPHKNLLAKYCSRAQKLDFSVKGSATDRILEEEELYRATAKYRKKVNTEVLS